MMKQEDMLMLLLRSELLYHLRMYALSTADTLKACKHTTHFLLVNIRALVSSKCESPYCHGPTNRISQFRLGRNENGRYQRTLKI